MTIVPVDSNAKNLEKFDVKGNKEKNEREVRLHEQSFEKTSWTESLKTFEWNNDFPLYDRIKGSFVDLKMSKIKRKSTLDLTESLWYKMNLNEWDEKKNTPEINKKFVILSIVDVVNQLNIVEKEQTSLRDGLVWTQNLNEWKEGDLHYVWEINDPDYTILKWLEKNKDLNLTEDETALIWEKFSSTDNIIKAILAVDEWISDSRKHNIISKVLDIQVELNRETKWLPDVFTPFSCLDIWEWNQDNVINMIWNNYAKISWWDWRDDIDTAINRSLNKLIHNKIVPHRYSELMRKNIDNIRKPWVKMEDKVEALRIVFLNVNWVMWFSWKTMIQAKERVDSNAKVENENIDDMYQKVLWILKRHSDKEKDKFSNWMDKSKDIQAQIKAEEEKEMAALDWNLFDSIWERWANDENFWNNGTA